MLGAVQRTVRQVVDALAEEVLASERKDFVKSSQKPGKSRALNADEDIKRLLMMAATIGDVWDFLLKRLKNGGELQFMVLSVVDEQAELLRLRHIYADREEYHGQSEFIPLCDQENHLIKTVTRADTTFTNRLEELGREVYPYLHHVASKGLQAFSVPLVAGGKTIAVITLGFDTLDAFSQARLSYVYTLRDTLAQLTWNLILQERLMSQPQVDNLTGLMTHSSFHQALRKEWRKAKAEGHPLSVLLLNINDLKAYNEAHSHQMGDKAIAWLASIVKREVRGIDTVARFGGDDLAVLFPETDTMDAILIADRILQGLAKPHKAIQPFTLSLGIATYPQDASDPDGLMSKAQQALGFATHQARHAGQSAIQAAGEMAQASEQERIEVFTAQMAKKYGEPGSGLFESVMRRMENPEPSSDALMLETVASLAGAMDAKDRYTRGHSQAVANYAVALAHAAHLPPAEVEKIRLAAFFHDIGKIGIPESILHKPGPLTEDEKKIMDEHPVIGARQILQPVTALKDIVPMVEYHHERWDGTGHPMGLKGEAIPIGARIVSVVDAFHALTSNRPYRKAMTLEEAIAIIKDGAGSIWDPSLVQTFMGILDSARREQPMVAAAV